MEEGNTGVAELCRVEEYDRLEARYLASEHHLSFAISSRLHEAEIRHFRNRTIDIGDNGSDCKRRAVVDFEIIKDGKVALIIEAKARATTHGIITAVGQCVFYSHYWSLADLGSPKPFSKCIICVPDPFVAGDLSHTLDELGIELCAPDELVSRIRGKLET